MTGVTHLLSQIESGDPDAAERLLPLVYDELRKLAAAKLARERPGQTLQATALVHEAYLRLVDMDTRQVIARFEAERQALAMMDHPNIAKVFDANATETGRPYFVMELVRGIPITNYCDAHHLEPERRLQLFLTLCYAVQHARVHEPGTGQAQPTRH